MKNKDFIEGVDFYIDLETRKLVLTSEFLKKRGFCCNSKCKNCPYKNKLKDNDMDDKMDENINEK
jgi:sulfatase maturation enzyme AslB (radical SAM superfamily)